MWRPAPRHAGRCGRYDFESRAAAGLLAAYRRRRGDRRAGDVQLVGRRRWDDIRPTARNGRQRLRAQLFQRAQRQDHHDDHERRGHHDHRLLQRGQSAGQQQHRRRHGCGDPPESGDQPWRVRRSARAEDAHHDCTRIRAADEPQHDEHHHGDADGPGQRKLVEQREKCRSLARLDGFDDADALGQCQVDCGTAEDHEPDQAHRSRQQQHAQHELTDGPPLRDAGDEGADEGGPRDPPRPVEDGPAPHPSVLAERAGAEHHRPEVVGVEAKALDQAAEDVAGWADDDHEQRNRDRDQHAEVGQELHPLADAGGRREHEHGRDDRNEDHLNGRGVGDTPDELHRAIDLQRAHAQRGDQPEQRGQHRGDVERLAEHAVDPITEDRAARGAHQVAPAVPVAEIGERQAGDGVDRPPGDAPVQERVLHGEFEPPPRTWRRPIPVAGPRGARSARRRRRTAARSPSRRQTSSRSRTRFGTPAGRRPCPAGYGRTG